MPDPASYEIVFRTGTFILVASGIVLAERLAPCRGVRNRQGLITNLCLFVGNTLLVRLISASSLVTVGVLASSADIGVFTHLDLPVWMEISIAVVVLDLSVYGMHRLFHRYPLFWRFHSVHHADPDFDVTTAVRFHPGEILLSLAGKAAVVAALGAPIFAIILFEALLSSGSLFTHGNFRLPATADRILRKLVVTPDMHRIHHSTDRHEHNRNFGFCLSVWDRVFGSYLDKAETSQSQMSIGLEAIAPATATSLVAMLGIPFRSTQGNRA